MIVGLDLANGVTGFAVVPTGGPFDRPPPTRVGFVRGAESPWSTACKVWARVDEVALDLRCEEGLDEEIDLVRIERPAPTMSTRDGEHGAQADIGWTMGRLAGLVEALVMGSRNGGSRAGVSGRVEVLCPDASVWRPAARLVVERWAAHVVAATPPTLRPKAPTVTFERDADGKLRAVWPCGHRSSQEVILLGTGLSRDIATCPKCDTRGVRKHRERSDAYKRLAVEQARLFYPTLVDALVADAASRARTAKEPHELIGVADACEALWLALTAPELNTPSPSTARAHRSGESRGTSGGGRRRGRGWRGSR